ncbi:hypothetical protein D3C78_1190270 [compost metagenome]
MLLHGELCYIHAAACQLLKQIRCFLNNPVQFCQAVRSVQRIGRFHSGRVQLGLQISKRHGHIQLNDEIIDKRIIMIRKRGSGRSLNTHIQLSICDMYFPIRNLFLSSIAADSQIAA